MLNRILTHITARRKPPKASNAKASGEHVVHNSQQGVLLEDYDEGPVPSYPPFQHGIPAASVRQVMETQSQLVQQIKEQLGLAPKEWDKVVHPMLVRYAEIVHLLPASEAHHHRGAGGLFRHGLEAGFWACRSAENKIFTKAKTPMQRRGEGKRWEVAALTGGLAHDVGKTISDVSVTDREGLLEWNPHQPLAHWLAENKVRRYFLHWNGGREHKRHESFSVLFMAHIIQGTTKAYLLSHPEVMDQLLRVVSGQGEDTEFGKVVLWADRQSVSRDLKHQRISPDEFAYGVPVEKYVLDALRSLVGTKEYQPNKPPYAICVAQEGVYLKWQPVVSAILAQLRRDDIRGVPSNPDTLARLLIERGLATGRPAPTADAPDAYFLYHEMKPRAKGLAALTKTEADKYLLIHDPDMIFPSTALPQTMEVELTSLEDRQTAGKARVEGITADEPEKKVTLEKTGAEEERDRKSPAQAGGSEQKEVASSTPHEPDVSTDSSSTGEVNQESEVASQSSDESSTVDGVGSHISFEDLISGNVSATADSDQDAGDSASEDSSEEGHEEGETSQYSRAEGNDRDLTQGQGSANVTAVTENARAEVEGNADTTEDQFDLDALINEKVGEKSRTAEQVDNPNAAQVEIPDFLKSVPLEDAIEEDDSIEYEDIGNKNEEQDALSKTASGDDAGAEETCEEKLDKAASAQLGGYKESSSRLSGDNNLCGENPEGDNTNGIGSNAPNERLSANARGLEGKGEEENNAPDTQVIRTAKVLESKEPTSRELLAEADMRLIKQRQNEERFQKRRKRKLEKAAKSTTDQFDVDATLEAKKRGQPLTLEYVRSKSRKDTELAKVVADIGVYVPGLDVEADRAALKRKIVKDKVDIADAEVDGVPQQTERVEIDSLLGMGSAENSTKETGHKHHKKANAEANTKRPEKNGGKRKTDRSNEKKYKVESVSDGVGSSQETEIEASVESSPSKDDIIKLHQHIQQDMLHKTKSHLPEIDAALVADSIIYSLVTLEEPLGKNVYANNAGRLLVRYPGAIEAHMPRRPKTQDAARIAREMKQAALVSHLNGATVQDGPVQRDPETGEMVLAFTIAINKRVQKLLRMVELCLESGEEIPKLSRLTHKSERSFEEARKEIQSSIDRQKASMTKEIAKDAGEEAKDESGEVSVQNQGDIECVVNDIVQSKQGAAASKKNINVAVLKVIAEQVVAGKGALIEDQPIYENSVTVSVRKNIVERAAIAANHKHVTSIALGVHTRWVREGMSDIGMGIKGVSINNGRFYVYLKGEV